MALTAESAGPPSVGAVREDGLLAGRVRLVQPVQGYRAATDPVLLAAAVPARSGDLVLDLGCGAGAAMFCLMARVTGLEMHGLEIQRAYLDLARRNAALNGAEATLHEGDLMQCPEALRQLCFDHVMLNPPYQAQASVPSAVSGRDRAHRESGASLAEWITAALRRLKPGGWMTVIHRVDRAPALLGLLDGRCGAVALRPLAPRAGRAANRVIVRARKGAKAPFRLLPPLVLHQGARHLRDGDDYTPEAADLLRRAAALDFQEGTP